MSKYGVKGMKFDIRETSSGNSACMAVKSPGSDNVGYDLSIAIMPWMTKTAKRGSCL